MEKTLIASSPSLRAGVLNGSMIMLVSSGFVGALNLFYNLAVAHELGAGGFGQASGVRLCWLPGASARTDARSSWG